MITAVCAAYRLLIPDLPCRSTRAPAGSFRLPLCAAKCKPRNYDESGKEYTAEAAAARENNRTYSLVTTTVIICMARPLLS